MRKTISMVVLVCFLLLVSSSVYALTDDQKVQKLKNEISYLQKQLAKTKNKTQVARIKKLIAGDQAKLNELQKGKQGVKLEITSIQILSQSKFAAVKGGLAGGALLIAGEYMVPVGSMYCGGELGYAIGNNFGIIDIGAKGIYYFGNYYGGLELSYGGYSKDVTDVAGLSGTVKSGIGVGILGGTTINNIQLQLGYNTILGLRADAGYRFYL